MGLIVIPTTIPSTKKVIISLWFRVPHTTLEAAKAEAVPGVSRTPMQGIIPLVIFGPKAKSKGTSNRLETVGTVPEAHYFFCAGGTWQEEDPPSSPVPSSPITIGSASWDEARDQSIDPSYIGIDCWGDSPALSVNIVMPTTNQPTTDSITTKVGSVDYNAGALNFYQTPFPCAGEESYPTPDGGFGLCITPQQGSYSVTTTVVSDDDFRIRNRPETFRLIPNFSADPGFGLGQIQSGATDAPPIVVTPDHWHHVLLSFDFNKPCITKGYTVTQVFTGEKPGGVIGSASETPSPPVDSQSSRTASASRMWLAYDDVNYTGKNMSYYFPRGYWDVNAILPVNGFLCATTGNIINHTSGDDCAGNGVELFVNANAPTYSFSPQPVPFSSGDFGIPATDTYVDQVKHVEMGQFQLFIDVTIDTDLVSNRRAFVSKEGKPVSPGVAAKLLGKKAEVLLSQLKDWQRGRNVGTLAATPPVDGLTIGDIEPYNPKPNLRGNQGVRQ